MNPAKKALTLLTLACSCISVSVFASNEAEIVSKSSDIVSVEIIDSFADMHTGPGRGYPVFYTMEQGEQIKLLKRKTHWFFAETSSGDTGWIPAQQLARTMKPSGIPVNLPSLGHGEYLNSAWRVGFTLGELEGAENFSLTGGYRALSWLGVELEYGELFLSNGDGSYYGGNLILEPFSNWVVTPFVSAGLGKMKFAGNLQGSTDSGEKADYSHWGVGLNYYIGFNFLIRSEYRWYTLSEADIQTPEINEWKLGFSTFF